MKKISCRPHYFMHQLNLQALEVIGLVMIAGSLLFPGSVSAQSSQPGLRLVCSEQQQDCRFIPPDKPFFKAGNLTPGQTVHNQMIVVNRTSGRCYLAAKFTDNGDDSSQEAAPQPPLARYIDIFVDDGQQALIQQNLASLYRQDYVRMGQVAAGRRLNLHWMAILDKWKIDNRYQGSQAGFDLTVNIVCLTREEAEALNSTESGEVLGTTTNNDNFFNSWEQIDYRLDWMLLVRLLAAALHWNINYFTLFYW